MRLSFRTIRNFGLIIIALLVILQGIIPLFFIQSLHQSHGDISREIDEATLLVEVEGLIDKIQSNFHGYLLHGDADISSMMKDNQKILTQIKKLRTIVEDEEVEDITDFQRLIKRLGLAINTYLVELQDDPTGASTLDMEIFAHRIINNAHLKFAELIEDNHVDIKKAQNEIQRIYRVNRNASIIILGLAILLGILVSIVLAKTINEPIQHLINATRKVSSGDYLHKVDMDSDDEFGALAQHFNQMTNRLIHREGQLNEVLEDLRESEGKYRYIFENMFDVIYTFDLQGKITSINQAVEQIIGMKPQEVIGKDFIAFVPQGEREKMSKVFASVVKGKSVRGETMIKDKNGVLHHIDFSGTRVIQHGEPIGTQGVIRDITSRKKAEILLKQAKEAADETSRIKSQFLSNVSHEVRTPLNGIIGFAETVLSSKSLEEAHDYTRLLLKEAEILLTLINDLLDHAKIEAGKLELEYRPMDVRRLLSEIRERIDPKIDEKKLAFNLSIAEQVPTYVVGDTFRINQILMNLIINAIKFTEEGSIDVNVECQEIKDEKATIHFSVEDTGIGIPKEKIAYIFQSFTQADGSINRKYGGTGLGTTISQSLVEAMGGRIGVNSELGKGAVFWFSLPMEISSTPPEDEALSVVEQGTSESTSKGRILVVEDYPTNQQIMQMHLETVGYTAVIAEDGEKALEICQSEIFDLVYMDLQMPNMDGYEATRQIRKDNPQYEKIPIIALTANADESTRLGCLDAGMNDVLTKPIRRDAFLAFTAKWISQQ